MLYRGMRDVHINKSELAGRVQWHLPRSIACLI